MMDIAAAVLMSLIWFLDKYRLGPLTNYQAALEYGYRAGLLAARDDRVNLHQVIPLHQGRLTANGFDRGGDRTN